MTGIQDIMRTLGFYDEEIAAYELLLNSGSQTAARIHEQLPEVKKGLLYKTLDRLVSKKLVEEDERSGEATVFPPLPPDILTDMIARHEQRMHAARDLLEHQMPLLRSTYLRATKRPLVRLLNGKDGLRETYEDALASGVSEVAIIRPRKRSISTRRYFGRWFDEYQKRRLRAGIKIAALTSDDAESNHDESRDAANLYARTWMNPGDYSSQTEIRIYGNKIVCISYGEELFALTIEHEDFAQALRDIYRLAERGARTLPVVHDHTSL